MNVNVLLDYDGYYEDYVGAGAGPDLSEILDHCLLPILQQIGPAIGGLVAWCVVFRIITQGNNGKRAVYSDINL